MRRALRPWNSPAARAGDKRGRPRKEPIGTEARQPSCRWPVEGDGAGAACGNRPLAKGLMLCPLHAKVLDQHVGHACAWPGCMQTSVYMPLCAYHLKVAQGLLDPSRS